MPSRFRLDFAAFAVWRASPGAPSPDVSFVPPLERRRLTLVERAALSVAWQVRTGDELPVVFSSRYGEIGVTEKLMRQFESSGEMSPAGFSASVHNAAPGAFSLRTRNHAPYTAIAARSASVESGIIESVAMRTETIFVYAEEATPEIYVPLLPAPQIPCSLAVRIAPSENGQVVFDPSPCRDAEPVSFDAFASFLSGDSRILRSRLFSMSRPGAS